MQKVTLDQSSHMHLSHLPSHARVGADDDVFARIAMHQVAVGSCSSTTSSKTYVDTTYTPSRSTLDSSRPANIYDSLMRTPSKPANIFDSLLRTDSGQDAQISGFETHLARARGDYKDQNGRGQTRGTLI